MSLRAKSIRALSTLALLFIFPHAAHSEAASNFAPIKLPRGVELQIPKGWWLLGAEHNRALQTTMEASMDLTGIRLPDGEEVNLIAANSMPKSTYAAVRVDSTIPPSASPAEVAAFSSVDLKEIESELRENLQKLIATQGGQILDFFGCRVERISGHPTLVTEYRRTGPKGPVFVQINQIFTPSQEVRVNLSYREFEVALWKPVIGKVRQSILVRR